LLAAHGDRRAGLSVTAFKGGMAVGLTRGAGSSHNARDFAEDSADIGGYGGHDRPGSNGHKTCHERVFNEILAVRILPDPDSQHETL